MSWKRLQARCQISTLTFEDSRELKARDIVNQMTVVLVIFAVILFLLWKERQARRRMETRADNLERSRIQACLRVYNGWVASNWFDYLKDYCEKENLHNRALASGIQLRDITEDEANIDPWDTPETVRQRGKDGLLPWEMHPDRDEIMEKFKNNVAKERERMGVK
jgi:hypothetical protein